LLEEEVPAGHTSEGGRGVREKKKTANFRMNSYIVTTGIVPVKKRKTYLQKKSVTLRPLQQKRAHQGLYQKVFTIQAPKGSRGKDENLPPLVRVNQG